MIEFFILIIFITLAFAVASIVLGARYDMPPVYMAKQMMKQGILGAMDILVQLCDPVKAKTRPATVEPADGQSFNDEDYYMLTEEFFRKAKLSKTFHMEKICNETIRTSRFHFSYQPYDEPVLLELRKAYNLDDVVAPAKDEFEAMLLLRNWGRSQFRRNDYQPRMAYFNALKILRKNIRNKNSEPHTPDQYRPCHFFPLFYSQILLSMGYTPRIVRISGSAARGYDGYDGHGMTEVWSNKFRKWILMDPDLNLHYEKDGIPVNMLEIHNERYESDISEIKAVQGKQTSGDFQNRKKIDISSMIEYHSYIQIVDMRNDWLTNHYFKGHPKRSNKATLFWIDKNLPSVFNFKQKTDNADDFYWTLNQTEILANQFLHGKTWSLAFKTFTPNYKHFEITIDDLKKIVLKESVYAWDLHHGRNRLSVCSVNKFGIHGLSASVEIWADRKDFG